LFSIGGKSIAEHDILCYITGRHHFYGGRTMAYTITDACIACGSCISECPVEAIAEGDIYVINADLCTDCGSCASICPVEAPVAK